jgi:hypothetical protein
MPSTFSTSFRRRAISRCSGASSEVRFQLSPRGGRSSKSRVGSRQENCGNSSSNWHRFPCGWSDCGARALRDYRVRMRTVAFCASGAAGLYGDGGGERGDHLIVAQQLSTASNDTELLLPLVEQVERVCGERPQQASADSGFFSLANLGAFEACGIDGYVPDSNLACVLNRGGHQAQANRSPAPPASATLRSCRENCHGSEESLRCHTDSDAPHLLKRKRDAAFSRI